MMLPLLFQDAANQWGWATAAVIPELEHEIDIINSDAYKVPLTRLRMIEELLANNQVRVTYMLISLYLLLFWQATAVFLTSKG